VIFHREHLAFEPIFADVENFLFHFVQQAVDLVLLFVRAADTLGGGGNDLAENLLVAYDLQIVLHVGRGRNEREQIRDERRPADAVEQIPVA